MSGYDKFPDYGGPPPTWRSYAGIAIMFVVVVGPCVALLVRWLCS